MSHEDFPTESPAVVTCGLPYANGDLHVGHLRTYVSGDILSRALATIGQQTAFVSGSDMHGTPIAVNADQEGVSPEEFALEWHETYEETFPKFDIEFDNYGNTHDETNTAITRDIVRTLDDRGYIYEKEIEVAWDPIDDQPLPDRYVVGTCPYCGETARGDECDEGCGRHLEPGEIEDPKSTLTGNPAEYRTREHKFFRVSDFQEYLQGFIDRLEGTSNAQNQPREWIEGDLQDWCITRDLDWGIDYPGDDEEADDLVLYVWVDAPIEYISSTKQYTERVGAEEYDWETVWRDGDSGGGEIVHVIGRDIIQHHTVFWPAMLHGADYAEPRAVMASGFVNLEGRAFSTSRNRAIWADDYLDTGFSTDLLRYYLSTAGSFERDVDFTWERFQERVNTELADDVGNFVYRALLFATRNYDGTPDADVSEEVEDAIRDAMAEFQDALNDYSLRRAGDAAIDLARFGNEYIQRNEPWKLTDEDPDQAARVIRDTVQLVKAIAVLLAPFTPEKAETVWSQLEEDGTIHDQHIEACLEAPPETFGEPTELFEKIEDETVDELNEQLAERVAEADAAAAEAAGDSTDGDDVETDTTDDDESKPMTELEPIADERISFEEFQELDIRVGEILAAEPIEGADKLVRLEVDIGVEERQVVAGIRQLHDVEALPGTRIVLLANLEKAELFGVESNGMILAAGEDADLLTTHDDAEPGTKIR
ncbi:Methionyl-tRNA synthetase [Halanaeroarchaeum sp. HSR-CO]|uniref:methionine--tRNA ligase n=1 Tax=Halanaeroarchaeum sp. HSR-CO TaxID=2866382 RepID=UPI00217D2ABE|nr:methionine--tRNA ligase [Halanaeroarchaeum sp. HSR-CO]UWG47276.1 Methionyl-tRNA synthetase [Halanaeroarchaeum sp. HSR-CO]